MNLFSQFHENADKIPNSKAMGYLPKKWEKTPEKLFCQGITQAILSSKTDSFGLQKSTKEGFLNYFQAIHTVIICGDLYWFCLFTWMEHV